MGPRFSILNDSDIEKIVEGAFETLEKVGIHVGSSRVLKMLASQKGLRLKGDRVMISQPLVEKCLKDAPKEIQIFRQDSKEPLNLGGDRVHYVADSVGLYVLDGQRKNLREPTSKDLIDHIKILNQCSHIDFQSGALVVNDVPKPIASSYRYYLSLLYSPKPMFGGAFGVDDLSVIRDMLIAVAGNEDQIEKMPIAVVAINPSSPLGLTEIVVENLIYCAEKRIPAMLIPIPLAGGSSPVTLAGTLVQHTAENLGALVISQVVQPGAPLIFGGGPATMDMRKGTACQASTEAVIMGASIGQIAKRLQLPSATNTGRADSKVVDYQAGEESGIALTLMALAGLNMIRGAGSLEYASVISKEKLIIDNEICGMAKRMVQGIDVSPESLALDLILLFATSTDGYLSSSHTLKWFQHEMFFPSDLIDRASGREFEEKGRKDTYDRAVSKVETILSNYVPREIDPHIKREMDRIIVTHAKKFGMEKLPVTEIG